jgi:hypothetical protein
MGTFSVLVNARIMVYKDLNVPEGVPREIYKYLYNPCLMCTGADKKMSLEKTAHLWCQPRFPCLDDLGTS